MLSNICWSWKVNDWPNTCHCLRVNDCLSKHCMMQKREQYKNSICRPKILFTTDLNLMTSLAAHASSSSKFDTNWLWHEAALKPICCSDCDVSWVLLVGMDESGRETWTNWNYFLQILYSMQILLTLWQWARSQVASSPQMNLVRGNLCHWSGGGNWQLITTQEYNTQAAEE